MKKRKRFDTSQIIIDGEGLLNDDDDDDPENEVLCVSIKWQPIWTVVNCPLFSQIEMLLKKIFLQCRIYDVQVIKLVISYAEDVQSPYFAESVLLKEEKELNEKVGYVDSLLFTNE